MEMWGLILNTLGVVILAFGQNRIDGVVRLWVSTVDFAIETVITPTSAPMVYFAGMDRQMKNALWWNSWISGSGWSITALGFVLQLLALKH